MLRELIVHEGLAADATFTAATDLKTGMGVVLNYKDHTAGLPESTTADNIVLVQKMPIPTGRNAALTQFSDYEDEFNTVNEGDKFVAYDYPTGDTFATDQYNTATLTENAIGKTVAVGTDGLWTVAESASRFKFVGLKNDNGHVLAKIYVSNVAVAN
ncbi:MAG: hypothetical protein NC084_06250 [Bacteroides sp.]|nr:hypothetical protein [Eubacterium sp.]MCM1418173.1 hypothetical protein [Roseburia sp.]MCM1462302.1 hypothetical protein [Bacteroides sp.]